MFRTIQEWGYLPVSEEAAGTNTAVTRAQADALLRVARTGARALGGGDFAVLMDGRWALRAQQVVGVLPTREVTLEILPKIDGQDAGATRASLVRMLTRVLDLPIADGEIARLGVQSHDLLEVLIRLFADRLFAVLHRGLPRRYVGQQNDLPVLRGSLNVHRQFTRLAVTPQRLASRFEELDPDFPLNRVLKATVNCLRKVARSAETQRRLAELAFAYADIGDMPLNRLPWEQVRRELDRTNRVWHGLVRLAEALLGRRYQTTASGASDGFSLLFEMNALFEEFIGRELRRALQPQRLTVVLQGPRGHALVDQQNGHLRFATKPDVFVHRDSEAVCIIDTKWKRLQPTDNDVTHGVANADVYQMMAYAHVYGVSHLMLLYPHHPGMGCSPGPIANYRIQGTPNTHILVCTVDLSSVCQVRAQLLDLVGHFALP